MFFQNNTRSKFTSAQNQTLFLHEFYQLKGQWLSGNIGYSSVQANTPGPSTEFLFTYHSAIPEKLFQRLLSHCTFWLCSKYLSNV